MTIKALDVEVKELGIKVAEQEKAIEFLYENLINCVARIEALYEVFDYQADEFETVTSATLKERSEYICSQILDNLTEESK